MAHALTPDDYLFVATRIHVLRDAIAASPRWRRRLELDIDNWLWSASVDGVDGALVTQDSWVKSGGGLRREHFENVPSTARARRAFMQRKTKEIRREHVVPRAVLRAIVQETPSVAETARVVAAYARIALIHHDEEALLKQRGLTQTMPEGWSAGAAWSAPPASLPCAWARLDAVGIAYKVHRITPERPSSPSDPSTDVTFDFCCHR